MIPAILVMISGEIWSRLAIRNATSARMFDQSLLDYLK